MVIYGISALIACSLGYSVWQLLGMIKNTYREDEPEQETIIPYPFGLTPNKVERLQKIIFYAGLLLAIVLYLTHGIQTALSVFAGCFVAGLILKRVVEMRLKRIKQDMKRELPVFLDTFLSLYQSGVKMEVAMNDALVVTKHLPYAFHPVLLKWHDREGPEAALETLRALDISELKTCATMLTQVVRGSERSLEFLKEWKDQLAEMEHLNKEAGSAKKPIFFTVLLGLPFASAVVTWFYPFFIQAKNMFNGFLGM